MLSAPQLTHIPSQQPSLHLKALGHQSVISLRSDRHQPPTNPTSRQAFEGIRPLVDTYPHHYCMTDFSPSNCTWFKFQTLLILTKCKNLTTPENYQLKFPATNYAFNAALSSSHFVRPSVGTVSLPYLDLLRCCCRAYFRNITCCFYC